MNALDHEADTAKMQEWFGHRKLLHLWDFFYLRWNLTG
jgi:hypothetical protein